MTTTTTRQQEEAEIFISKPENRVKTIAFAATTFAREKRRNLVRRAKPIMRTISVMSVPIVTTMGLTIGMTWLLMTAPVVGLFVCLGLLAFSLYALYDQASRIYAFSRLTSF